jgi:hypothetical protein
MTRGPSVRGWSSGEAGWRLLMRALERTALVTSPSHLCHGGRQPWLGQSRVPLMDPA